MTDPMDIATIRERLDDGSLRVDDLIEGCLASIRELNPVIHALLPVDQEAAHRQAEAARARRRQSRCLSPLDGVPIVLKDLIEIEGEVATNGSLTRLGERSRITAHVVDRLRASGLIIIGKAQMVEFAYGGWGTNWGMGAPRNPWDTRVHRSPGGSSSGSGVAVASGMLPVSLGSDTGGSIRIPAALQGLTGFKPTVGLISLYGCLPLSRSFDSIGPLARSVHDAAWITSALTGYDARDPLSRTALPPQVLIEALEMGGDLRGRKIIATPEDAWPVKLAPAVARGIERVIECLRDLGVSIEWREPPFEFKELLKQNSRAIGAEVWAQHGASILDESLQIDPGVRLRMLRARLISELEYGEAIAHAQRTSKLWSEWMNDVDAWLMPGCPISAPAIDGVDEGDPILSTFMRVANHLGGCALSLPAGLDEQGLPIGVQLIAPAWGDAELIRLGAGIQYASDWHRLRPGGPPGSSDSGA